MKQKVRVYLVDDHAVVREGYKHLLEQAQITVIAESSSGEEAYQQYKTVAPDVVVIDLTMTGIGGIETIRRIKTLDKQAKLLAFSMHDDIIFATKAMQAGASGYVTKSSAPNVLVDAVFKVAQNKRYLSVDIAAKISQTQINPAHEDILKQEALTSLSAREFEVFERIAKGLSLDEIASTLHLDYKTVANIQTRLRQKLHVENTAQLVLAAIKLNVLRP